MDNTDTSASEQIDSIIKKANDWRGDTLAKLRAVVTQADPGIVEEVKWKKPSKPEGVPVWTYNGNNVCIGEMLKNAVRVTFPNGAAVKDPKHLFNTRLDSKSVRAIDIYEDVSIDIDAFKVLIIDAVSKISL